VCLERLRATKEKLAMFDNVVRLIGFVGSDAELKTTKAQREYAVLSLATTASWKDKNGDGYIRRTEWHKLVAWRNLSLFAATLKKGAHVSVEGELRYREFVPKKQNNSKNGDHKIRVAEIHLSKIAKLDRAEKRDSDAPVPELRPETQDAPF
jgi:single-strand DNA-binding protein